VAVRVGLSEERARRHLSSSSSFALSIYLSLSFSPLHSPSANDTGTCHDRANNCIVTVRVGLSRHSKGRQLSPPSSFTLALSFPLSRSVAFSPFHSLSANNNGTSSAPSLLVSSLELSDTQVYEP